MRSGLLRLLRAVAVVALACLPLVAASPDLYCGAKNCYDILSLPGTATKGEIKKVSLAAAAGTRIWRRHRALHTLVLSRLSARGH